LVEPPDFKWVVTFLEVDLDGDILVMDEGHDDQQRVVLFSAEKKEERRLLFELQGSYNHCLDRERGLMYFQVAGDGDDNEGIHVVALTNSYSEAF
jgi:hypothetical protein